MSALSNHNEQSSISSFGREQLTGSALPSRFSGLANNSDRAGDDSTLRPPEESAGNGEIKKISIFISYCHENRADEIRKIASKLSAAGFNVWIDVVEMKNDLFVEIPKAIKQADIVIIFFSEEYKKSRICEKEAICAFDEKRNLIEVNMQPENRDIHSDTSVGFILKGLQWISYPQSRLADEIFQELKRKIAKMMTNEEQKDERPVPVDVTHKENEKITIKVAGGPPVPTKYHQSKAAEDAIKDRIAKVCKSPLEGVFILKGGGGTGKTTIMARLFLNEENAQYLGRECGIRVVLWINCYKWRDQESGTPLSDQTKSEIVTDLCKLGISVAGDGFNNREFVSLQNLVSHYGGGSKVLFALDDVFNVQIADFMHSHRLGSPICVISRNLEGVESHLFAQRYQLQELPFEQIVDMLEHAYQLLSADKLLRAEIELLANRCCGLPLIAGLIAGEFCDCSSRASYLRDFQRVQSMEIKSLKLGTDVRHNTVEGLFDSAIKSMVEHRVCYYTFLFFEHGESIRSDDLAVFWGAKDDGQDVLSRLSRRSLATRKSGGSESSAGFDTYLVHQMLFEAAERSAIRYYGVSSMSEIRYCIITSGTRTTNECTSPYTRGLVDETAVLCDIVKQQRRHLLEMMIDKLDPDDLTKVCCLRSKQLTGGRTFLHFLYHQTWSDNIVDLEYPKQSINYSYRLISKIFHKLRKGNNLDFIKECDEDLSSFLTDIFDDKDKLLFQDGRINLTGRINKWEPDYAECSWEKRTMAQLKLKTIFKATRAGDLAVVKRLLASSANDVKLQKVVVAFHAAAMHGRIEIISHLMENHSDLVDQATNEEKLKAFMFAASNGHVNVMEVIVANEREKARPFMLATSNSQAKAMVAVINKEIGIDDFTAAADELGMTAAMYAARKGQADVIEYLCGQVDSDYFTKKEKYGITALAFAARHGFDDVVQALAEANPDAIMIEDDLGQVPLSLAASNGHLSVVKLLLKLFPECKLSNLKNNFSVLMAASLGGNLEIVELIHNLMPEAIGHRLAKGDVDPGFTALMFATKYGHLDIVKYLCEKSEELAFVPNSEGYMPLSKAGWEGHLAVFKFLYNFYNAKKPHLIHHQDDDRYNAFIWAVIGGHLPVVRFFCERSSDILKIDKNGERAFKKAITHGFVDIVAYLHERDNSLIKKEDEDGNQPLVVATIYNYKHVVDLLYKLNPDYQQLNRAIKVAAEETGRFELAKYMLTIASDEDRVDAFCAACQFDNRSLIDYMIEHDSKVVGNAKKDGATPICFAVAAGKFDLVKKIAELEPTCLKALVDKKNTVLHYASCCESIEVLQFIYDDNKDAIKMVNELGSMPLHVAAFEGSKCAVQFFYNAYPDAVNHRTKEGKTLLMLAAQRGRIENARFLFEKNPDSAFDVDEKEVSALMLAAANGHTEVVEMLCSHSRCVDMIRMCTKTGETAFMLAAGNGHLSVAKFLYEKDHSVISMKDKKNNPPLGYAAWRNHLEVARFLLEVDPEAAKWQDPGDRSSILQIIFKEIKTDNCLPMVELLYEAYPEAALLQDGDGDTPLFTASGKGYLTCANYLAQKCPSALLKANKNGLIPLIIAAKMGHLDVVKFLHEANPETLAIADNDGMFALTWSTRTRKWDVVKFLLEKTGPDAKYYEKTDDDGCTPLARAALDGQLDLVKILCQCFPKAIEIPDEGGRLPIGLAALNGHLDVVQHLHDLNSETALYMNKKGWNAVGIAVIENEIEIVRYLLEKQPDAAKQGSSECPPLLFLAAGQGKRAMVELVYKAYPEAIHSGFGGNNVGPMHIAAYRGNLDTVDFLLQCDPAQLTTKDASGDMPVAFAFMNAKNGQLEDTERERIKAVVNFFRKKMEPFNVNELLDIGSRDNIAALLFNAELTINHWECLMNPLRLASTKPVQQFTKDEIKRMLLCLSSLWSLTDENPQFCHQIIKSSQLAMLMRLLEPLENSVANLKRAYPPNSGNEDNKKEEASEANKFIVQIQEACDGVFGVLGNLAEVADIRPLILSATPDLTNVLSVHLKTDLQESTQALSVAHILANLLYDTVVSSSIPANERDAALQELFNRVKLWAAIESFNPQISLNSLKPFLPMLGIAVAPEIRCYALWFLVALVSSKNRDKYRKMVEKEGVKDVVSKLPHDEVQVDGDAEADSDNEKEGAEAVVNNELPHDDKKENELTGQDAEQTSREYASLFLRAMEDTPMEKFFKLIEATRQPQK